MSVSCSSYLKLDELLALQQPLSGGGEDAEHDEMLFNAEYLRRTLFKSVFPDLWAIRAEL